MSEAKVYPVFPQIESKTHCDNARYQQMYRQSIDDPEAFWAEQAQMIEWFKPWDKVWEHDFTKAHIRWFEGAQLNVSHNCLDRHLATRADQVAIIWEGDDPNEDKKITYRELHAEVCRFANALKTKGVKKGERVTSRQKIGTLGKTGRTTGPHVHYEVLFNGKPQNPAKFLTAGKNVFKE